MTQNICDYLITNYSEQLRDVLNTTKNLGREGGMVVSAPMGAAPRERPHWGSADSIHLGYPNSGYPIGIQYHTHTVSETYTRRLAQQNFSAGDWHTFVDSHLLPASDIPSPGDGHIRGIAVGAFPQQEITPSNYRLTGLQLTDKAFEVSEQKRLQVAQTIRNVFTIERGADTDHPAIPDSWPYTSEKFAEELTDGLTRMCRRDVGL